LIALEARPGPGARLVALLNQRKLSVLCPKLKHPLDDASGQGEAVGNGYEKAVSLFKPVNELTVWVRNV